MSDDYGPPFYHPEDNARYHRILTNPTDRDKVLCYFMVELSRRGKANVCSEVDTVADEAFRMSGL